MAKKNNASRKRNNRKKQQQTKAQETRAAANSSSSSLTESESPINASVENISENKPSETLPSPELESPTDQKEESNKDVSNNDDENKKEETIQVQKIVSVNEPIQKDELTSTTTQKQQQEESSEKPVVSEVTSAPEKVTVVEEQKVETPVVEKEPENKQVDATITKEKADTIPAPVVVEAVPQLNETKKEEEVTLPISIDETPVKQEENPEKLVESLSVTEKPQPTAELAVAAVENASNSDNNVEVTETQETPVHKIETKESTTVVPEPAVVQKELAEQSQKVSESEVPAVKEEQEMSEPIVQESHQPEQKKEEKKDEEEKEEKKEEKEEEKKKENEQEVKKEEIKVKELPKVPTVTAASEKVTETPVASQNTPAAEIVPESKVTESAAAPVVNTTEETKQNVAQQQPLPTRSTNSAQEDAGTIGSQSNLTDTATATIVPSTNSEEPKQKSRFIRRSKSVVVDGKPAKELNVSKRKSQILSLFKRGNEKEKTTDSSVPPLPALPTVEETSEKTDKKQKRKTWKFWKTAVAQK